MRSLVLSALALVAPIAAVLALTAPAQAATVNYVALGDSYSSGDGAGSYYSDSGDCLRSSKAYSVLWTAAHSPSSFSFVACSGAKTGDVSSSQLSALSTATTLISISIGGNDIGFASVMETCVLHSDSTCLSAVAAAKTTATTTLPTSLRSLFTAIRAKSPAAKVVVLDYPHLYKITSLCIGLSNTKRTALNSGADTLDSTIQTAAGNAGFTFADVRSQFSGHELCSGDGWLNSITLPIDESYHPTATGQASGYLPVFTAAAG